MTLKAAKTVSRLKGELRSKACVRAKKEIFNPYRILPHSCGNTHVHNQHLKQIIDMHDLLGLEYINTIMCHYLKTEAREAQEFSMLHPILLLPLISEKTRCFTPSICCAERGACVYVCVCIKEEKRKKIWEDFSLHCLNAILLQGKKENETAKSYLRERFVFICDKSRCRFEPICR